MLELKGNKFNKLLVLEQCGFDKHRNSLWLCQCDCGNQKILTGSQIKNGKVKSCGCLQKEFTSNRCRKHGMWDSRLYHIWHNMNNRCYKKNDVSYKFYGGSVTICDEWIRTNKYGFYNFIIWAYKNGYNENLTIDRVNCNGNYEPNNCRWITMKEQQNNKKNNVLITYNNETHTLSEWADITGINYRTLNTRHFRKWPVERLFKK